jgi:RND superfamily putative drug exporter
MGVLVDEVEDPSTHGRLISGRWNHRLDLAAGLGHAAVGPPDTARRPAPTGSDGSELLDPLGHRTTVPVGVSPTPAPTPDPAPASPDLSGQGHQSHQSPIDAVNFTTLSYRRYVVSRSKLAGKDLSTMDQPRAAAPEGGRVQSLPLSTRRPWVILAVALLAMVLAGLTGGDVQDSLSPGGFTDASSESERAAAAVQETFGTGSPHVVIIVDAAGDIDDPAVAAAGTALTSELADRSDVLSASSYWSLGSAPPLRSSDGTKAMVLVRLVGDDAAQLEAAADLRDLYHDVDYQGLELGVAGEAAVFAEVNETVESDLISAELIAFPITAVLLLLIFGSVTSALLPLAVGGFSILGTFVALETIAGTTEVSVFALNFTTAIGLGLAIDYALLIVNRFRDELRSNLPVREAVAATVRTAGRTVLFSGLTVASSLTALLVFPFPFLRSFALAGFAVVGLAVVGATVVLPAALTLLGHRVNSLAVRRLSAPSDAGHAADGVWHRIAMTVMRRPVPIALAAVTLLVVLGLPFLRLDLGLPDDRVLGADAETRQVSDAIREEFSGQEQGATTVFLSGVDATGADAGAVAGYAAELSALDGVARVDSAAGSFIRGELLPVINPAAPAMATADATYLSVVPDVEPLSSEAEDLIDEIRAVSAPGDEHLVGGPSAGLADSIQGLLDRLPLALALIAAITFSVLFWAFGSLLIPAKAIVLNVLSLSGTMGAMVWVFQDGRFEDLIGFTATGSILATMPVLMLVIAFGLSMDYEVFLLSRIREEWLQSRDPVGSVAVGLERTGRIVTAAAVLIAVVFLAFGLTASVSFMAMFGFGMTLAVVVDAFVIRTTLVPAFMRLAGRGNWWAPGPLRRLHDRIGFDETGGARSPTTVELTGPDDREAGGGPGGDDLQPAPDRAATTGGGRKATATLP